MFFSLAKFYINQEEVDKAKEYLKLYLSAGDLLSNKYSLYKDVIANQLRDLEKITGANEESLNLSLSLIEEYKKMANEISGNISASFSSNLRFFSCI